ncbi:uncharacterized protein LOC105703236 [Orussus abietinus]|uniref:uncharacterized protein LOC105703236 n=1 Tax=Orussus abietinus TaxID=222816 RepID=UPI000625CCC8|nr:uncharacterized protein LOC105703236 [Orussus abietinus]
MRLVLSLCLGLVVGSCCSEITKRYKDGDLPGVQQSAAGHHQSGVNENSKEIDVHQSHGNLENMNYAADGFQIKKGCPLCDSSVYPYCGDKLLHDACCCTDPYLHELPYICRLADCKFLHANSCREHRLISNCCCSDQYRSLLRSLALQ